METQQIGQYILEEKLGAGGMAEVWKARNVNLGNYVAVKFLNRQFAGDPEIEQRFLGEGKRQANLQHPNVVSAFDFLYIEGRSYLVMKYVKGENLEDRLIRLRAPLPLAAVVSISKDVLGALEYAHSENIVHRDIKPSNIMLENSGRALVMDFGIAVVLGEQRVTRAGVAIGTPHYMSPEQIVGAKEFDQRSDIYSYGCVLYQMLTEKPPFDAVEGEGDTEYFVKHQHVLKPPRPLRELKPDIPEYVETAVLRCLEKNPADRFASCGELLEALSNPPVATWARTQTMVESAVPAPLKSAWQTQIDRPVQAPPAVQAVSARTVVSPQLADTPISTLPPIGVAEPKPVNKKPIGALLVGLVLLAGAGGGFLWYRSRPAPPVAPPVVTTEPKKEIEQPPPQEVKQPVAKPVAKKDVLAPVQVKPGAEPSKKAELNKTPIIAPQPVSAASPVTPVKEPAVIPAPVVASNPTSGVLHCPGNPVHQGETVEFPNQPKERRRYTFDQNAWRLYNKNGLDGTKTLVLESKLPGVQTSCTVSWEVVP